jgi:hypothetical protein
MIFVGKKYLVTREFIIGTLQGQTYTEKTNVRFTVGFVCGKPCGGSPYRILSVEEI